jgi:hypothetical protein
MNKQVQFETTISAYKMIPVGKNSLEVWDLITIVYTDGTTEKKEVLNKIISFDCITDWC